MILVTGVTGAGPGTEDGEMSQRPVMQVAAGATLADHQPQDDVRVMFDPAGHPFCLFLT